LKINTALVGIGNCSKALLEGIAFYTKNKTDNIGLMHPLIGKYHPSDIDFVMAFDVDKRKVGKKLSEAIYALPNRTIKISNPIDYNVTVKRGPTCDSIIPEMTKWYINESKKPEVDLVRALKDSDTDIVINFLPTGSDNATYAYADAALKAGCCFINCMPTPIAKSKKWRSKFQRAGLVLLGDDIKSQCGATILNRSILTLMKARGVNITRSSQINFGGNADHFNLKYRPLSKKESKGDALRSVLGKDDEPPIIKMRYVEENYDHKQAKIKITGMIFGHIPVSVNLTLEDEDSPNSAGVVIDAIRATKVLMDRKAVDEADKLSPFLMKSPATQYSDSEAINLFNEVIGR